MNLSQGESDTDTTTVITTTTTTIVTTTSTTMDEPVDDLSPRMSLSPPSPPSGPPPSRQRQHRRQQQRQRQALVYAVPGGPTPGIYFGQIPPGCLSSSSTRTYSREDKDDEDHHPPLSIPIAAFHSFVSQADAEQYLENHHPELVPLQGDESKGWMTTSRSPHHHPPPILYTQRQQQGQQSQPPVHPKRSWCVLEEEDDKENDDDDDDILMVGIVPDVTSSTTTRTTTVKVKVEQEEGDADMEQHDKEGEPGRHTRNSRRAGHPPSPKKKKGSLPILQLDETQQRAIEAAREGKNVFLTGVAGTGKSMVTAILYQEAVERWGERARAQQSSYGERRRSRTTHGTTSTSTSTSHRNRNPPPQDKKEKKHVALCAPTGMASVALGPNGQTIHSLAGVTVPLRASDFAKMHSHFTMTKWLELECLIIDECGMLSADFIDWLDVTVRSIRHCPHEPFGGIQLIFVGDFCQLGPVPGNLTLHPSHPPPSQRTTPPHPPHNPKTIKKNVIGPPYPPDHPAADCFLNIHSCTALAFQSALWREANFVHVALVKVYRQSDQAFVSALQDLREQRPDSHRVQTLVQQCSIPLTDTKARYEIFGGSTTAPILSPPPRTTNHHKKRLDVTKEEEDDDKKDSMRTIEIPPGILPTLLYTNNRNADRENSERLAALPSTNASKRFEGIDSVHVDPDVPTDMFHYIQKRLLQDKYFEQCQASKIVDLKVGAQVMLIKNLYPEEDLVNGSRGVVEKFALVPMIRAMKGTGEERLLGPDDVAFFPSGFTFEQLKFGMTVEYGDQTWKIFKFVKMPTVRFLNGKTKIIVPANFERTLFRQGTCRRQQLPLRLAWALTIHKAQGCTLDWLICDLDGCFTAGQAYVALSRARSMAGLQIRNFSPRHVMTNPLVDGFYQALAKNTIPDFLRNHAGLWWYPLLQHPEWLKMFREASSTANAKKNSKQFQLWMANYKPDQGYQGWMGYTETAKSRSTGTGTVMRTTQMMTTTTTQMTVPPPIRGTHGASPNLVLSHAPSATMDSTSSSSSSPSPPSVTPDSAYSSNSSASRFFLPTAK